MLTLREARMAVAIWNDAQPHAFVPWEVVEGAMAALQRFSDAITAREPPENVSAWLDRHNQLARRVPDALLLAVLELDDDEIETH